MCAKLTHDFELHIKRLTLFFEKREIDFHRQSLSRNNSSTKNPMNAHEIYTFVNRNCCRCVCKIRWYDLDSYINIPICLILEIDFLSLIITNSIIKNSMFMKFTYLVMTKN